MKLQQGKWYVCIRNWSDDGWTKFAEGDLVRCDNDNVMVDCYGIGQVFLEDDEPERIFREATDMERNIASATEVNINEFLSDRICSFDPEDTLLGIYRRGAEVMLHHIKTRMNIKGMGE